MVLNSQGANQRLVAAQGAAVAAIVAPGTSMPPTPRNLRFFAVRGEKDKIDRWGKKERKREKQEKYR